MDSNKYMNAKLAEIEAQKQKPLKPSPIQDANRPFRPNQLTRGTVNEAPPPLEFLFDVNGTGLFQKDTVSALAATGGTGKSFFLLQAGLAIADNRRSVGMLKPAIEQKVLYISAEDSEHELRQRLWNQTGGDIPENFTAVSIVGEVGPLLKQSGGNVEHSEHYQWIDGYIGELKPDVVMIDPFSRLYGLNEIDSMHGTAWVSCVEALRNKHGVSIIVAHHCNEASVKEPRMNKQMLRGNSALSDGYRAVIGMRKMTEATGREYGIVPEEMNQYIEMSDIKRNGGKALTGSIFFRQDQTTGGLHGFSLTGSKYDACLDAMLPLLDGKEYTENELRKGARCKPIIEEIKAIVPNLSREKEMPKVIEHGLAMGMLKRAKVTAGKITKEVIIRTDIEPIKGVESEDAGKVSEAVENEFDTFKSNDSSTIKLADGVRQLSEFDTFKPNDSSTIKLADSPPLKGEVKVRHLSSPPGECSAIPDKDCRTCQHQNPDNQTCLYGKKFPASWHKKHGTDERLLKVLPYQTALDICGGRHWQELKN